MPSDINWDGVLQIAYLLIIFIAPALLNRLRGKGEDFINGEKSAQEINASLSRAKPVRKVSFERSEPDDEDHLVEEDEHVRPAAIEPKHESRSRRRVPQHPVPKPKHAGQHKWLERLPKHELRRAVLLKTILDAPVASRH